jgi:hypothetical protein
MATKEISIIIKARNMLVTGLAQAGKQLQAFGSSVMGIGKWIAGGFLAAGTAVTAFAVKAISAFSESEKATQELRSALVAYGDAVDVNVTKVKAFAAAIQEQTGIDDDQLVSAAAKLRMLGVEADKLEAATKATVALKSAGMEQEQATKAVAMAMAGEYSMLSRYIPQLKTATTEAEKAAAVNDFLTRGYQSQKDALGTVSGQWGLLKTRIGNVLEEIGAAINSNGQLQAVLNAAGEAIKGLGEKIAAWVAGGGVGRAIATAQLFGENIRNAFNIGVIYAKLFGDQFRVVFEYIGSVAGATVNVIVAEFNRMRDFISAVAAKVRDPFSDVRPPDMAPVAAAWQELGKTLRGEYVKNPDIYAQANKEIEKESQRHLAATEAISAQQLKLLEESSKPPTAAAAGERIEIGRAVGPDPAMQSKKKDYDEFLKKREDIEKQIADKQKEQAEEEKRLAKEVLDEKIRLLQEEKDKRDELLRGGVQGLLGKMAEDEAAASQESADKKRAKRLEDKMLRGTKLSKKDLDWLGAWQQLEMAKNPLFGQPPVDEKLQAAKDQLTQLEKQTKSLEAIQGDIFTLSQDLNNLLQRG